MMQRRLWIPILLVGALVAGGCGGSSDENDGDDAVVELGSGAGDEAGDGSSDDGAGTDASGGSSDDGGENATGDDATDEGPDTEDAAEILGDPDLDLEELPEEAAELLDEIDDIVLIGDCQSDVIGLGFTAPDGWQCRVLDVSLGGIDGFTLFTEGNELNITVGTPSPIQACEVLQACDTAVPIDLGAQWPNAQQFELAGTVTIWASHASADAEVVITKLSALTTEELDFVRSVLDSTMEVN